MEAVLIECLTLRTMCRLLRRHSVWKSQFWIRRKVPYYAVYQHVTHKDNMRFRCPWDSVEAQMQTTRIE